MRPFTPGSHIDVFPRVTHWLRRHEMFIHVYLMLKIRDCTLRAAIWTEAFVQQSVTPHQRASKQYLLFEFTEKNWQFERWDCFLSKVTIYKTESFQWSSTRAVVKTMLYLFGTHAYWTERPVPKIISANTCTVTPLAAVRNCLRKQRSRHLHCGTCGWGAAAPGDEPTGWWRSE